MRVRDDPIEIVNAQVRIALLESSGFHSRTIANGTVDNHGRLLQELLVCRVVCFIRFPFRQRDGTGNDTDGPFRCRPDVDPDGCCVLV